MFSPEPPKNISCTGRFYVSSLASEDYWITEIFEEDVNGVYNDIFGTIFPKYRGIHLMMLVN